MKDRVGAGVNVVTALLAGVGAARRHRMKVCPNAAGWARDVRSAVVDLHELGETRRVIRVLGLKLLECVLGHGGHSPCG